MLVLEGSVQRHRGQLRIHARLVDRQTHRVRDSFRFDGATAPDGSGEAAFAQFALLLAERVAALGFVHPSGPRGSDGMRRASAKWL